MKICILKETAQNEKRVALVPDVAKKLINDGFEIFIESGAGNESDFSDEDYKKVGVESGDLDTVILDADIIFSVKMPDIESIKKMKSESCLIGLLNPYDNHDQLKTLSENGQLAAFEHLGFWQPMDTLREKNLLESLWSSGKAPWKSW